MYTNEDLNKAVDEGIFTQDSVISFRQMLEKEKSTRIADEENFRLVSSFNDIFVVIATIVLLASVSWMTQRYSGIGVPEISVALLSWGLAEVFVRKRAMALPAIVLLASFLMSVFTLGMSLSSDNAFMAGSMTSAAAFLHWKRFYVPATIAAGAGAVAVTLIALSMNFFPSFKESLLVFVSGLAIFAWAMKWDISDKARLTRKSDVAFWLHLLAAPMIVHPVFYTLGVFDGGLSGVAVAVVVVLYIVLSSISLIVDRRAFMVSSLAYVIYALSTLFGKLGFGNNPFAGTSAGTGLAVGGLLISAALLLLTAYWATARAKLISILPKKIQENLPAIKK